MRHESGQVDERSSDAVDEPELSATLRPAWVRQVAVGYEREGYEVIVDPAPELVPTRLEWLRFDLVARRDHDNVLVLIEGDDDQLRLLDAAVSEISGWRLAVHRPDEVTGS